MDSLISTTMTTEVAQTTVTSTPSSLSTESSSISTASTTVLTVISSSSTGFPVTLGAVGGDNDDGSAVKIAVGILVPLAIICCIGAFIFYKWYRRKYPVRMPPWREFAKFENPDYLNRVSTLSLVRDDADDYFSRATSKAASTVSLDNRTAHDNLAFESDKNYNPSDDDYDIVKRKSFLFKSLEENRDWMETELNSGPSSQSSVFESNHTESDKASEISNSNSPSTTEPPKVHTVQDIHRSQEELNNLKNSTEHFPKDTPVEVILDQVKDRRALTDDPTQSRQHFYDESFAKSRSQSADPISPTQGFKELDRERSEKVCEMSRNAASSDSDNKSKTSEEESYDNLAKSNDVAIEIDEIDAGGLAHEDEQQTGGSQRSQSPETDTKQNIPENVSIHSNSTDESDGKDAFLLANTEFSDSGSISDIHISVKAHSDSVQSLRGDSDANQSGNSSRHSPVVEFYNNNGVVPLYMSTHAYQDENFDTVLNNEVFLSDVSNKNQNGDISLNAATERSEIESKEVEERKDLTDNDPPNNVKTETTEPSEPSPAMENRKERTPSVASSESRSSQFSSPVANPEDTSLPPTPEFQRPDRNRSVSKSSKSSKSSKPSSDDGNDEYLSPKTTLGRRDSQRTTSESSESSESSGSSASSGSYHFAHSDDDSRPPILSEHPNQGNMKDESSDSSCESENEQDEIRSVEDTVKTTSIASEVPLGVTEPLLVDTTSALVQDLPSGPEVPNMERTGSDSSDFQSLERKLYYDNHLSIPVHRQSIGPSSPFSPDSVSVNSNTISSVTSSDDEGVYVLNHDKITHLDVDSLDFDDNGLMFEHTNARDITPPSPNHGNDSLEAENVNGASPAAVPAPVPAQASAEPTTISKVLSSESDSGSEIFTDEDILKALEDSDISDDDDHEAYQRPSETTGADPPRNIVQTDKFRFDDDDDGDDIDV